MSTAAPIIVRYPNQNFNTVGFYHLPRVGDLFKNLDSDKVFRVKNVTHCFAASQKNLPPRIEIVLEDVE
jgi:hypothetical protein